LLGVDIAQVQFDRAAAAREISAAAKAVVVLKGATSIVADRGGQIAIVPTGNPGMASGGTGDVLAGMTAGLWAQHPDAFAVAAAAAYIHGWAGDRVAQRLGQRALLATDLLEELPDCLAELERRAGDESSED